MADSAKVIITYPYQSRTGTIYNSILLVRDGRDYNPAKRFALPGGTFDLRYDRTLEDTAVREVKEELGLTLSEVHALGIVIPGYRGNRHLFTAKAQGALVLNYEDLQHHRKGELLGIGFWNAGEGNKIPDTMQQQDVQHLKGLYKKLGLPITLPKGISDAGIVISAQDINDWRNLTREWRKQKEGSIPPIDGGWHRRS